VPLPHHPAGACKTKLRKPTVAICSWVIVVSKETLAAVPEKYFGGIVQPRYLETIISIAQRLDIEKGPAE